MIFHLPVKQELLDTNVSETVAIYDENLTYIDGAEVRVDDSIFMVTNKKTNKQYQNFQDFKYYYPHEKVNVDGRGYQRVSEFADRGCWSTLYGPDGYDTVPDKFSFEWWDGVTFNHGYNVGSDNTPCENDVTFTFRDNGYVDNYRNIRIDKIDNSTLTGVIVGVIKLYDEIVPDPNGCFIIDSGKVIRVRGKKWADITTSDYLTGQWIQLEKNYEEITIKELSYLRPVVQKLPFDTKQYTSVEKLSHQYWSVSTPNGCNAVVLGNVVAEDISVLAFDVNGAVLQSVGLYIPFSYRDSTVLVGETLVLYIKLQAYEVVDRVLIELSRDTQHGNTSLGMIMPTYWQDVGATNLIFNHSIKNYDKNFVSEVSGYVEHIKGNRVLQHKGSFDIPLQDYDKTVRLNKQLTQELIAIDGSDNTGNENIDSINIFASTQIIGRVKSLTTATTTKNKNKIDDYLKVNFEFEEIV